MTSAEFKSIEQQWLEFWLAVGPKDAPAIQEREMRRAFYSGFHQCMSYTRGALAAESVSEEVAVSVLVGWEHEAAQFCREIVAGKA